MSATAVQLSQCVMRTPDLVVERYQANRDWKLYPKEWIYRNFPPLGKSWLDFGCGTGEILTQLAKLGASQVVGIDINPQLVERARLRAELDGVADRAKVHCGDIATLQPEPVDIVLSFAVLHHLPDRLDEVVHIIRSWLKPGGIFICVEPVCYLPVIEWMRQRSGIPQDNLDPGERKLTISDLECIAAGFTSTARVHFRLFGRFSRLLPRADKVLRRIDSVFLSMPGVSVAAGTVMLICRTDSDEACSGLTVMNSRRSQKSRVTKPLEEGPNSYGKERKVRALVSTSNHYRNRFLAAAVMILIAASCFSQLKHFEFIRTIVHNSSDPKIFEKAAMPGFIQQNPNAPKLLDFRRRHIAPVVVHANDVIAQTIAIQHWVREQQSDEQFYPPMVDNTEEPEQYLEQQRRGVHSACRRFSYILTGALLSVGINARVVSVSDNLDAANIRAHNLVEVWIGKWNKWILVDPTIDAFVLVNGRPASLLEVRAAAASGSKAYISLDQHGSRYRLPPLNQYRSLFQHVFVARTNAIFDGYRYGLLVAKRIEYVHYAGPGIEPYPEHTKELLLFGLVVSAGSAAFLTIRCSVGLLFWLFMNVKATPSSAGALFWSGVASSARKIAT